MARDVYSFGLLVVHVACGSPPLSVTDEKVKNNEIQLQEYVRSSLMTTDTPPPVIEMTLSALRMQPEKRPNMKQILIQL